MTAENETSPPDGLPFKRIKSFGLHQPPFPAKPKSMRAFVFLSATAALSSCVLGPQPGSPDVKLPVSIRGDTAPHGQSFGDKAWPKVFTDSTLRNLINRALANNPDLVAATYRIERARAQANAARSNWFPQVDGSTGGSANYRSINGAQVRAGGDRHSESYDVTALLSWEVDLWGGIRRDNEAARARLLQAEYNRDAVQTSLIAAVASAYIQLKNLDDRLEISRTTAKSRQLSLDLVTSRRDGGVSSDLEVGQAEALLKQAQIAIPITEQAIAARENEIHSLLGEYPGSITRGGSLNRLDSSLRIVGGLPSSLMERRPDVAAADQAYQAATADIGVAEALRLPNLSLTGSGGIISSQLNDLLQGKSGTYTIGPRLAGPIFDAGRGKARVDAARAAAGEALIDRRGDPDARPRPPQPLALRGASLPRVGRRLEVIQLVSPDARAADESPDSGFRLRRHPLGGDTLATTSVATA